MSDGNIGDAQAGDEANNGKGADDSKNAHASGSAFYKEKVAKLESENIKLRGAIDEREKKSLLETENYKVLYEGEAEKRQVAEAEKDKVINSFKIDRKQSAIKEEAIKLGIRDEAINDINFFDSESVIIETTDQGNLNIIGAKEHVEKLKTDKPYMFKDSIPPNINNGAPVGSGSTEWSASKILEMERTKPAEYNKYMKSKYGLA